MRSLDERLSLIGDALQVAVGVPVRPHRRPRPIARTVAIAVVVFAVLVGSALAASSLLGGPAPAALQTAIDEFYPADPGNTMAPAPGGATIVASSGEDVLYRLPARDGTSTCLGIALAHVPASRRIPGEGCMADTGGPNAWLPIGLMGEGTQDGRQLIYGRLVAPAGATLSLEPDGQAPQPIAIGSDGFFLAERTIAAGATQGDPATRVYARARLVLRDETGGVLEQEAIRWLLPGAPA